MKKIMTIPALTLGALLISSMAFAWSGGHGRHGCDGPRQGMDKGMSYEQHEERMERHLEFMGVALDLTDDQKKQREELGEKHWQERQELRDRMRAGRDELRELGRSTDFDEGVYRAKAREQADLKTDMRAGRAKMKQEFFAVLTPEQQAKAEKLWDMHKERRHGQRGGCDGCEGAGHHRRMGRCGDSD